MEPVKSLKILDALVLELNDLVARKKRLGDKTTAKHEVEKAITKHLKIEWKRLDSKC